MHHECFQEQIIRSSGLAAGPARSCTWHCRRGVRLQDLGLRGEKCVGKRSIVRHQRAAEQHLGHVTDNAGKLKLTFESMTAVRPCTWVGPDIEQADQGPLHASVDIEAEYSKADYPGQTRTKTRRLDLSYEDCPTRVRLAG